MRSQDKRACMQYPRTNRRTGRTNRDGEPFDNPKLTKTADRVFEGTRAQGKYTPRDAYDALEIAVNNYLLEKHARELMQMDVTAALASVLRPLMTRLRDNVTAP